MSSASELKCKQIITPLSVVISPAWCMSGLEFKIPLARSVVPRPTEYMCQVLPMLAQQSPRVKLKKLTLHRQMHGQTFDRFNKTSRERRLIKYSVDRTKSNLDSVVTQATDNLMFVVLQTIDALACLAAALNPLHPALPGPPVVFNLLHSIIHH